MTLSVAQTGPLAVPVETQRPSSGEDVRPDRPWLVIVWNDPINLMSYVTYVFQKLFGYSRDKARGSCSTSITRVGRGHRRDRVNEPSSTSCACTSMASGRPWNGP